MSNKSLILASEALVGRSLTIATAESLTGGRLGSMLTSVPGSSRYYRGGVISYATDVKRDVLGVRKETLEAFGPVSRECAIEMAQRARGLFMSSLGISTTGVAGPDKQDGHAVGTLYVGIASQNFAYCLYLKGEEDSRKAMQDWAASAAVEVLLGHISSEQIMPSVLTI